MGDNIDLVKKLDQQPRSPKDSETLADSPALIFYVQLGNWITQGKYKTVLAHLDKEKIGRQYIPFLLQAYRLLESERLPLQAKYDALEEKNREEEATDDYETDSDESDEDRDERSRRIKHYEDQLKLIHLCQEKFLKLSVDFGSSEAALALANLYRSQKKFQEKDCPQFIIDLYAKAATEIGEAAYQLGMIYCLVNYKEAQKWFTQAKEQGHELAASQLSQLIRKKQDARRIVSFYKINRQRLLEDKKMTPEQKKYMALGVNPFQVFHCSRDQINGRMAGLTRAIIMNPNFGPHITDAVESGFDVVKLIKIRKERCINIFQKNRFDEHITKYDANSWSYRINELMKESTLKLHIGVSCARWRKNKNNLIKILDKAVNVGIICGYKYRLAKDNAGSDDIVKNLEYAQLAERVLKKILAARKGMVEFSLKTSEIAALRSVMPRLMQATEREILHYMAGLTSQQLDFYMNRIKNVIKSEDRICNNPITVYLPNTNFGGGIISFCREIEAALAKESPASRTTLSLDEELLYPHISIRKQFDDNGEYMTAALTAEDAKCDAASDPHTALKKSVLYRALAADAASFCSTSAVPFRFF